MKLSLTYLIPDDIGDEQFAILDGVEVVLEGDPLPDAAVTSLLMRTVEEFRVGEMIDKMPEPDDATQADMRDGLALTNARLGMIDDVVHMPPINELTISDKR